MSPRARSVFLSLAVALAAFVIGGGLSCLALIDLQNRLQEQISKRGFYVAGSLAYNSKYGLLTSDRPLLQQLAYGALHQQSADGARPDDDVALVAIRDAAGAPMAVAGWGGGGEEDVQALPPPADHDPRQRVRHPRLGDLVLFRAPVWGSSPQDAKPEPRRLGTIDVAFRASSLEARAPRLFLIALLGTMIACAGSGLLIYRLTRPSGT